MTKSTALLPDTIRMSRAHVLHASFLFALISVASCSSAKRVHIAAASVSESACVAPWREAWTADSAVALCIPAGFRARGPQGFARSRGDTLPEHWIGVSVTDSGEESNDTDPWPLRLASGPSCIADCTTVGALRVYTDSIANVPAYVEVGRVSGGISGEVRLPAMVLSAEVRPGVRLVVQARTPDTLLLDSLRMAARTARVGRPGHPPRAGRPTTR